jgi:hypothetical protein
MLPVMQKNFAKQMPLPVMPNYFELRLCCLFLLLTVGLLSEHMPVFELSTLFVGK